MDNLVFQNIDEPVSNPLSPPQQKTNIKLLLKDKKIILLVSLLILFIFIIVASLIVSQLKTSTSSIIKQSPPDISSQKITPTVSVNPNVSTQFQESFDKIDREINTRIDFLPPEINPDLGLK